ncbi:MAG: hypothetical protein ABMB14_26435 [Myxococcota bacterium]
MGRPAPGRRVIGWLAIAASAHDTIGPIGLRPFVIDGALVGAHTTWGIVARPDAGAGDGDDRWERVCEEALPGVRDVWRDPADGSWWIATASGLLRSTDGGCSTEPTALDRPITAIADLSTEAIAIVDDPDGDALASSQDGFATWVPVTLTATTTATGSPPVDLRTVAAGGDGWWASGFADGAPIVLRSTDHAAWEAVPSPDPAAILAVVLGPGPDGSGIVVSTLDDAGGARLWHGDPDGFSLLAALPLAATGYACVADRCLVAINGAALLGWDRAAPPPVEVALVDGPARCLVAVGDAVWACAAADTPAQFAVTTDGRSFVDALLRLTIDDRSCPIGTDGASACAAGSADTGGTASAGSAPEPVSLPPDPRDPCGCAMGIRAPGWIALGMCAVTRRGTGHGCRRSRASAVLASRGSPPGSTTTATCGRR